MFTNIFRPLRLSMKARCADVAHAPSRGAEAQEALGHASSQHPLDFLHSAHAMPQHLALPVRLPVESSLVRHVIA